MADQQNKLRAHEVFWSRDESDVNSSLVHVPGVEDPGNKRPNRLVKVKGRKTQEIKPVIPVARKPVSETVKHPPIPRQRSKKQNIGKADNEVKRKQEDGHPQPPQASLKELCAEDKQRVANLINELAKVGQEKEQFAQELSTERNNYQMRMKNLADQHNKILSEREGVQQQLLDCQRLLSRYQHLVSVQQEALNTSFSESPEIPDENGEQGSGRLVPEKDTRGQHRAQAQPSSQPSTKQNPNTRPDNGHAATQPEVPDNPSSAPPLSPPPNNPERNWSEFTPRGSKRTMPSAVPEERPFTTYIDKLIACEQNTSGPSHGNKNKSAVSSQGSGSKRTSSTGPLHEPVLSSTHQSDTLSISQQSRTRAGEFRPLQPDPSPRSSLQSPLNTPHPLDVYNSYNMNYTPQQAEELSQHTYHSQFSQGGGPQYQAMPQVLDGGQLAGEARVTFGEQLHQPSPQGPHHPAAEADDNEFITQYKAMTSAERQNHLMSQKAALLAEQQRLREILEEQECLLHTKQEQLKVQQDLQQSRLEHFEKNGFFPPEPVSLDPPNQNYDPMYHHNVPKDQVFPQRDFPPEMIAMAQASFYSDHQPEFDPRSKIPSSETINPLSIPPPHNPSPPQSTLPHTVLPISAPPMPATSRDDALNGASLENGKAVNRELEISLEEIEAVTDSMENLWFLQRHGIDVPRSNKPSSRKGHRSVGSSPLRPGSGTPQSHKVHTLEELIQQESRDGSADRHIVPKMKAGHRPTQAGFKGIDSKHAACLLDLVDQVENTHPPRHGRTSSGGVTASTRRGGGLEELYCYSRPDPGEVSVLESEGEAEEEDEAEESRILEEVFFVR